MGGLVSSHLKKSSSTNVIQKDDITSIIIENTSSSIPITNSLTSNTGYSSTRSDISPPFTPMNHDTQYTSRFTYSVSARGSNTIFSSKEDNSTSKTLKVCND